MKESVGKLTGGVAIIKVGAPTESAQKELKQRVEDAVAATRAAMEEGIVPGGGIALFNVNLELGSTHSTSGGQGNENAIKKSAWGILLRALEAPLSAIIQNSGENPGKVIADLKAAKLAVPPSSKSLGKKSDFPGKSDFEESDFFPGGAWLGFNAAINKIGDLKEAGIIDPLKVTKTAFRNAVSVASNYLTVGAAITEIPEKNSPAGGAMPSGGGHMDY